ncbi:hypothetical protein CAOG_009963 [Capsaspora owczarzaki ATCC 30864]|uniref:Uncharacterized protein n=1 Tax=Capsaspora owczarzaki (strain ATCC 30864) TaxID=595528 RepID=A0A0D2WTG8_CAPO3|nr:hypothetical protein CAOG_009963 [Capsaspora owczarzaki ATCC 30864]
MRHCCQNSRWESSFGCRCCCCCCRLFLHRVSRSDCCQVQFGEETSEACSCSTPHAAPAAETRPSAPSLPLPLLLLMLGPMMLVRPRIVASLQVAVVSLKWTAFFGCCESWWFFFFAMLSKQE